MSRHPSASRASPLEQRRAGSYGVSIARLVISRKALFDRAAAVRIQARVDARQRASALVAAIRSVGLGRIVCCAWCGGVMTKGRSADGAAARGLSRWRLPASARRHLSHGICETCFDRVASDEAVARALEAAALRAATAEA